LLLLFLGTYSVGFDSAICITRIIPFHRYDSQSQALCYFSDLYSASNYERTKKLGSGSYGSASLEKHKAAGDIVAIKRIERNTGQTHTQQMFEREVEILGVPPV
jgi:hypothetical protein